MEPSQDKDAKVKVSLAELDIGIIDLAAFMVRLAIAAIPAAVVLGLFALVAYRLLIAP